jgi:chromosome segregation protein
MTQAKDSLAEKAVKEEAVFLELEQAAGEKEDEQTAVNERGQLAAAEADRAAERLSGAQRTIKEAEEWLDNLDDRRLSLHNDAETLGQEIEILTRKLDELKAAALGLPERVKEADSALAEIRRVRDARKDEAASRDEAAREARKKREEAAKELSLLERDAQEAEYELKRLAENLLADWRAVLVDPEEEAELAAQEAASLDPELATEGGSSQGAEGDLGQAAEGGSSQGAEGDLGQAAEGGSSQGAEGDLGQAAEGGPSPEAAGDLGLGVDPTAGEAAAAGEPQEDGQLAASQAPPEKLDARFWAAQDIPPGAEAIRARLRERLAAMGEISLTAIEKETELQERYDYHKKHYDDLIQAIADLKQGINRVNQTCRELFSKTFTEANAKFREIFPVLFEGGEGWLGLSDEKDPLESGVEIHVHPPGKKIMVMSLLSGGEKALTALALIFALYLIKPSPFCLLDEADAPLDEANIDRFNRLLGRLSEASQIIMVTHNKRTMQICDTLYGVTMETPGVSRLVSVSLDQAEVLSNV